MSLAFLVVASVEMSKPPWRSAGASLGPRVSAGDVVPTPRGLARWGWRLAGLYRIGKLRLAMAEHCYPTARQQSAGKLGLEPGSLECIARAGLAGSGFGVWFEGDGVCGDDGGNGDSW
jgi:hypothetical protein